MTQMNNTTKKKIPWWVWVGAALFLAGCCIILFIILLLSFNILKDGTGSVFQEDSSQTVVIQEGIETELIEETPAAVSQIEPEDNSIQLQGVYSGDPLLVITDKGVWMANENTGETLHLSSYILDAPYDLKAGMSPDKRTFAYLTGLEEDFSQPLLVILDLEQEKILAEIELSGAQSQLSADSQVCDAPFEARRAIEDPESLAWSPDGQQLAFISARDGESADLYLFERSDLSVSRLSDEPSHVSSLHWSPNGQYIEYISAGCFGTGAGESIAGIWTYDVWSGQVNLLEHNMASSGERFLGWEDDENFLMRSWEMTCMAYGLRSINAATGEQELIAYGCFSEAAYDPQEKQGLLSVTESYNGGECFCGESFEPGLYVFSEDMPFKKFEKPDEEALYIDFIPEGNLFTIFGGASGLQAIYDKNLNSVTIPAQLEGLMPLPAPGGKYWAWVSYADFNPGLWVSGEGIDPVPLNTDYLSSEFPDPVWNTSGDTLYYVMNNQVYAARGYGFAGEFLFNFPAEEIRGLVK